MTVMLDVLSAVGVLALAYLFFVALCGLAYELDQRGWMPWR